MLKTFTSALVGLASAASAAAADWTASDFNGAPTLYVDGGAVAFLCPEDRKIRALVSLDGDVLAAMNSSGQRKIAVDATVQIDSATEMEKADYYPMRRLIVLSRPGSGAAAFNSAIRGGRFAVEGDHNKGVDLTWPAPDAAAFNAFRAACGF